MARRGCAPPALRAMVALLLAAAAAAAGVAGASDLERAFPIVEPDHGHTKLGLAKEGLEAIEKIKTPIAAVSITGPYRSGKSFLLNQLLSLSCDKGFGVGHMRDTKTKGIWVWGAPIEVDVDGTKVSVLYLDTKGFESVGKSNVYDDRIFMLDCHLKQRLQRLLAMLALLYLSLLHQACLSAKFGLRNLLWLASTRQLGTLTLQCGCLATSWVLRTL